MCEVDTIWQSEHIIFYHFSPNIQPSCQTSEELTGVGSFNNACKILIMKTLDNLTKYWQEEEYRSHLVINYNISVFLDCCEAAIRADCGVALRSKSGTKKKEAPKQFKEAFTELSREEKVEYYLRVMGYLRSFVEQTFNAPISPFSGVLVDTAWSRGRRWKEKKFRLDQGKHLLFVERKSKILTYDLKDYLVRTSKNKDYHSFVLLAINSNPSQKQRSLQMGFTELQKYQQWFESIKFSTEFREWEFYCSLYKGHISQISQSVLISPSPPHSKSAKINQSFSLERRGQKYEEDPLSRSVCASKLNGISTFLMPNQIMLNRKGSQEVEKLQQEIQKYEQKRNQLSMTKTMIGQLLDGDIIEEPEILEQRIEEEDEAQKQLKRCLDLFHKLCPEYDLTQLESFTNFNAIHEQTNFRIYQNHLQPKRFKMVISFPKEDFQITTFMTHLSKPETAKAANSNIEDLQIKTNIPSENSALLYQVLRPFNRLYRGRDFVFIRHVFRLGKGLYMVDKSIENANYPPFITIVRGSLCIVYGLFEHQDTFQFIADAEIKNEGYLNDVQETNLTLKFLRPYSALLTMRPDPTAYRLFDLEWDISKNQINQYEDEIRSRINTIKSINGQKRSDEFQSPITSPNVFEMKEIAMDDEGEINAEELLQEQPKLDITRQLSKDGAVIIDQAYRTNKYHLKPYDKDQAKLIYIECKEGHPIWRNDWQHDIKVGGITFINAKKIEDQKGVLRFILTKMAKNLVSGQSILNVSLPVDIFCPESNLQSFIRSMAYAPLLLENLEQADALTRLLRTIAFGVTNSVLYLNMEKPFNPQLGQTFQCWINGCPAYAEQISHHPPIASLLLKGRGYDVSAQLESKISVGVNSGTGTNDGVYRVRFPDHTEVCFMTPGGEVSGLAHGDRKFNFVGKSYYWVASSNLVLELTFDPYRKGFFSVGKQQQPCDYFEGTIWEVRQEFMAKFFSGKRRQPNEKERLRSLGKVSGVWNKNVMHQGLEIFNSDKMMPLAIEHESAPLPSDSNWREDIEYRRRNQTTRAQIEKQRLQVQQRADRKLRERKWK